MAKGMSIGGIAFLVGLVLAILIAVFSASAVPSWAVAVLAVLGLVVGLLNVTDKEVMLFLVAGLGFLLSFGALSKVITSLAFGWDAVGAFFALLEVFVAPAVAVVAVVALFRMARS